MLIYQQFMGKNNVLNKKSNKCISYLAVIVSPYTKLVEIQCYKQYYFPVKGKRHLHGNKVVMIHFYQDYMFGVERGAH